MERVGRDDVSVACLLRQRAVWVSIDSGGPLANLPASVRICCFEELAQRADDEGLVATLSSALSPGRSWARLVDLVFGGVPLQASGITEIRLGARSWGRSHGFAGGLWSRRW